MKKCFAEAKAKLWKNFGHPIESNYHSATKVFQQTICRLHNGAQKETGSVRDARGKLLTREDVSKRWKQHVTELYNVSSR